MTLDEGTLDGRCGLVVARCACLLPSGHVGAHACGCGGSWAWDEDGEFVIVHVPVPPGMTAEEADALASRLMGEGVDS